MLNLIYLPEREYYIIKTCLINQVNMFIIEKWKILSRNFLISKNKLIFFSFKKLSFPKKSFPKITQIFS